MKTSLAAAGRPAAGRPAAGRRASGRPAAGRPDGNQSGIKLAPNEGPLEAPWGSLGASLDLLGRPWASRMSILMAPWAQK